MSELKPCPFCGGKAFISARLPYFGEPATVSVVCENCNAASKHKIKEKDAIKAWNRRNTNQRYIVSTRNRREEIKRLHNVIAEMKEKIDDRITPKKPIQPQWPWYVCPNPNCCASIDTSDVVEHIENHEITYCEHCGQALDWSDDNA